MDEEVVGSHGDLEREVGPTPRVFAYPGGGCGDGVTALLEREGFELAFMTTRGVNDLSRPDWLRLRRINVGRSSGLTGIRLQLLPQWARLQRVRQEKSSRLPYANVLRRPGRAWYPRRSDRGARSFGPVRMRPTATESEDQG
jgi:hypothetical protein